ncbi:MAG: hypothetical protein GOVbin4206_3 [Prokaryotic dsDNA virus sp.]|nr:MAG: hypothetical protein GOVbin4206_3 [Prokaryotic dsDNA virus sp.]|tara:strand:+ start:1230 stop:1628 length:399 start_codon:yes stop_codon:yes gene_type:complete
MFNDDILIGIFIGLANCDIRVESNYRANLGYTIKPRIQIRGELPFLKQLSHALEMRQIRPHLKEREGTNRNKPIITISRIGDLSTVCDKIPDYLEDARNQWKDFKRVVELIKNKKHLSLEGLDEILKIKELI